MNSRPPVIKQPKLVDRKKPELFTNKTDDILLKQCSTGSEELQNNMSGDEQDLLGELESTECNEIKTVTEDAKSTAEGKYKNTHWKKTICYKNKSNINVNASVVENIGVRRSGRTPKTSSVYKEWSSTEKKNKKKIRKY